MDKKKILVVDDREAFGRMVKLTLEMTGQYMVEFETKGKRALSSTKKFMPDLIFLDIKMPDADGVEVMFTIKSDASVRDIPIVFLTALPKQSEVDSQHGMIGGRSYLAKPVTKEKLIECIAEHVGPSEEKTGTQ